jgi:hypothetical protein
MNRALLAAALALPIVALAAGIAAAEAGARGATVWRLPIKGYDPRDPVRGHYVRYRYDWQVTGNAALCRTGCALCLEDSGRAVRVVAGGAGCPARIDPAASRIGLRPAPEFLATPLAATGQIYVSEASAPALTTLLRERPAVVVARLTRGGRLIPDRIEPAP